MIAADIRKALTNLIALGQLTPREVADGIGISVQAVHKWTRAAGINAKAARRAYARRTLDRQGLIAERADVE